MSNWLGGGSYQPVGNMLEVGGEGCFCFVF